MKVYDTRKKDGRHLTLGVYEKNIWYTTDDVSYPDALSKIQKTYNRFNNKPSNTTFKVNDGLLTSIEKNYRKYDFDERYQNQNTIVRDFGNIYIKKINTGTEAHQPDTISPYWYQIDDSYRGNCILVDNGTKIESPYGYTYNDISNMIRNNDYSQYIKNNDYIILIINNYKYTMRFNIDIYYDYTFKNPFNSPHHIDFLSDEVLFDNTSTNGFYTQNNLREYSTSSGSNTLYGNNTSDPESNYFHLVNDKIWNKVSNSLSTELKSHIVEKTGKMPNRIIKNVSTNNGGVITYIPNASGYTDSPYYDISIGKVWQLREAEIIGNSVLSNIENDGDTCIQYPSCKINGHIKRRPRLANTPIDKFGAYQNYYTMSQVNDSTDGIYIANTGMVEPMTTGVVAYPTLNFRFV